MFRDAGSIPHFCSLCRGHYPAQDDPSYHQRSSPPLLVKSKSRVGWIKNICPTAFLISGREKASLNNYANEAKR